MGSLQSSRRLDMAPIEVSNNNKNTTPELSDDSAKERSPKQGRPPNEPEDFDVSDCFTDDLEELANGGKVISPPKKNGSFVNIEAGGHGEGKGEKELKPNRKVLDDVTIVLDSDGDDEASQDSLDTRIRRTMAKAAEFAKKEVVCENEDPDIVALKKDLYQSNGEIDYDLDLWEDEPDVKVEVKPKVEPKKEEPPMVVIKAEPITPVKQNVEALKVEPEVIPTIDLTSSDEEEEKPKPSVDKRSEKPKKSTSNTSTASEYVVVKAEEDKLKIRRKKRKSKKRSKRRANSSDCELIEDTIHEEPPKPSLEDPAEEESKEANPVVDQKEAEPKEDLPFEEKKSSRRPSTESDYVKATITRELQTPADSSDQKVEDDSIPIISTDIALEDLLNDFIEDETVPQNPSQVLFPPISNEEGNKHLLNSPLIDCERSLLAELANILKDDKPEKPDDPPEQPPLFTYTISEPGATPLKITVNATLTQPPTPIPKPRFRIVDGRIKYPPPAPPAKKRPGRPPKADPPPKSRHHRRYESDEEYIPSFARTRRISLRPRKPRRRLAPRARLVPPAPTGQYLTELQLQPEPDVERETEKGQSQEQEDESSSAVEEPHAAEEEEAICGAQSPLEAEDGVYMNMPSLGEELAGEASKKSSVRKRARPQQKQHIDDYFCPSPGTGDKRDNDPVDDSQPVAEPQISGKKLPPQPQAKRRKKRRISSSSSCDGDTTTTAAAESVSLGGTSSSTMTTNTTRSVVGDEVDVATVEQESAKTDAMRVVLSPLTDEKIEKLRKCNTPKKVRALSKACQTELKGLTWSIYLDQINFRSEYFEKLYQLIKNGREYNNQVGENGAHRGNDFQGVVMAGRDAVLPPTPPERSPQRPIGQANGHARSEVEELLFQRANEIEYVSTVRIDPVARERMERSVRSNFRIPKVVKQPSRSPQDVTSSTQHENDQQQYKEDELRRTSTGYSNDRPPEQRRQVSAANRSPQRFDNTINFNRPEPEPRNNAVSAAAETARPLRRTIRNDNVQPVIAPPSQPQPAPAPVPPVENGFPSYGAPEQPPQQYRPSGGNMFQQQQHQIGAYTAVGQDLDVKPNLSALAGVFGPNMINPTRFLDSFSIICQMTIMQMMQQQQQLQFSAMNPQGAAMPPVVGLSSQMMPQHGQLPLKPEPSTSGGPIFGAVPVPDAVPVSAVPPDEISDQISQIFGCIDHLKGRCIKNPCQYSHTLPTESNLRQMLLKSPQDVVMTTYQFIVGQDNLFMRYFPTYAEVMGRRNMRHQLVDAVPHCEQSKRAFSYYRCIVEGLTLNGTLNRAKAVQLVLEKHRKTNFDQINVLITLILDTNEDMPQFFQWLDQFSNVQDYHYEIASINRLLKFTARSTRPQTELIRLTYRLILSVPAGTETYIDTNLLLEFVELLIRSNLGLDPEKIRHKYRENELQQSATRR